MGGVVATCIDWSRGAPALGGEGVRRRQGGEGGCKCKGGVWV